MAVLARTAPRRSHRLRRIAGRGRAVLGGVLVTCSAATFMVTVALPVYLVGASADSHKNHWTANELAALGLARRGWVIALVITVTGYPTGRALLRGPRHVVVWLRRFRDADAIREVSSALDHIGRSWRVVTLDDAVAMPVGVAPALRVSTGVIGTVTRSASRLGRPLARLGTVATRVCVAGAVGVLLWSVLRGSWTDLLDSLPGARVGHPTTPETTLLWIFLGILLGEFAALLAYLAVLLAAIPFVAVFSMLGSVGRDVRAAEASKTRTVRTTADVDAAASAVSAAGAGLLAPRLTVLTVDSAVWQQTVTALAERASAVLLDVSVVTDNLLWEAAESFRLLPTRTVLVGRMNALRPLEGGPGEAGGTAGAARVSALLDGREVLGYRTGVFGRLRFQSALLSELEATVPPRRTGRDVARGLFLLAGLVAFGLAVRAAVLLVSDAWLR